MSQMQKNRSDRIWQLQPINYCLLLIIIGLPNHELVRRHSFPAATASRPRNMAFATAARVSAIAPRAAVAKRGAGACEGAPAGRCHRLFTRCECNKKARQRAGGPPRCRRAGGGARKHMCGTKMAAGRARGARKRAHAASGRPRERSTADQFAAARSALRSIGWHHRAPRGANCAGYATYTPGFPNVISRASIHPPQWRCVARCHPTVQHRPSKYSRRHALVHLGRQK